MKREEGFSLVRGGIIVALVLILAALVMPISFKYKESQKTKRQKQAFMFALEQRPVVLTDALFDGTSIDNNRKQVYYILESLDKQIRLPIEEFSINKSAETSSLEMITEDGISEKRYKLILSVSDLRIMVMSPLIDRGVCKLVADNHGLIFKDK